MLRHRFVLTLVAFLALGGLVASACGDGDESPITATATEPSEPAAAPTVAEPAPDPASPEEPEAHEPAPTPPEEPPPPATNALPDAPPEDEASEPPETAAAGSVEPESGSDAGSGGPTEPAGAQEGQESVGSGFSVTFTSDGGTWTLDTRPQRVVSLSPAATEILFAIGAGPQVVAVDNWSTHPPEAPTTDLSGFNPNVEAIASHDPDLVVIVFDTNDLVAALTALDIPVLVSASPFDISGGYGEVAALGAATGHTDEARDLIETMRTEIAEILADAPEVPVRIYHELDQTYYSASSNSFIGAVYAALGTVNIADPADSDGYGFPQLTEEYIIEADPQLIIITDLNAYTPEDVAARPGWDSISAVRDGNILVVNADIASRWGPRLPQFVSTVAEALAMIAEAP